MYLVRSEVPKLYSNLMLIARDDAIVTRYTKQRARTGAYKRAISPSSPTSCVAARDALTKASWTHCAHAAAARR